MGEIRVQIKKVQNFHFESPGQSIFMRKKGLIFDLYGTLIFLNRDSRPYLRLFRDLGFKTSDFDKVRSVIHTSSFASLSEFVERIKPDAEINLTNYEFDILKNLQSAEPYPESVQTLERLKSDGFKIGIVSNLGYHYKQPFYDLGLDHLVEHAVFSCDVGLRKPDPKIYLLAADKLNLKPSDVLMVGDDIVCDVKAPEKINIHAVLLDRKNSSVYQPSISSLDKVFNHI